MTDGYKIEKVRIWVNGEEKQIYPAGWNPGVNTLLYLPIDTSDTSTTVYDHSGNSKNNTWYGTASYDTLTSGKRVINLTGSNGLYIDEALITSQPCTVNVWLYRNGNQNVDSSILINQQDISNNLGGIILSFGNSTNAAAFYGDSSTWQGINNAYQIDNQTWKLLTVTLGNNTITSYLNGTQVATASGNTPVFSSVVATSIGFTRNNRASYNYRFFNGKMGTVIIENKVRTTQEISQYYNLTKSKYSL